MARNSLNYELLQACMSSDLGHKASLSDATVCSYKQGIRQFKNYCISQGANTFERVKSRKKELLKGFVEDLSSQGLSAATIHTYLAAPCRALDISLSDVEKPKRITAHGTRADGVESARSAREKVDARYAATYDFVRAVGCRESEARRLTGADLIRDEQGTLCILIHKGKGGKDQLQRILPQNSDIVQRAFEGKSASDRIFAPQSFSKNINYHLARAQCAQDAYTYYARTYRTSDARADLALRLGQTYRAALDRAVECGKMDIKKARRQRDFFESQIIDQRDVPYRLRGANLALATEKGKPVAYDRLALMATSVYHLSHWRLDVTVSNYLLR